MKSFFKLSALSLVVMLIMVACTRDEDELPGQSPEVKRFIFNAEQIPEVTSSLLQQMGLRNSQGRFSVNSNLSTGFEIDWDHIKQLVDSTGKQTYTFGIKDTDNDPSTFYNLVFQLSPENEPYQPYVLKYTMNEDFAQAYYSGQEDFGSFRGKVKKIVINPTPSQQRGVYEGGGEDGSELGGEWVPGEECPGETYVGNNSGGNGSPGGGGLPNDLYPGDDSEWMCEVYVIETDWYSCVSVGGGPQECSYDYTEYELVYENCGFNDVMSAYTGGDDACPNSDDNIPIVEPAIHPDNLEDYLLNCQFTPQECLNEALKSFREWGGEEGKAIADLIEEMISAPGLSLEDANEIYALAIKFSENLQGQYVQAIFSAENIATILSFGITNTLSSAARTGFSKAVARYANKVAGKGYATMNAFKAAHGTAGTGMHWHHIVERTPGNVARFGANQIHNTKNLVKIPSNIHIGRGSISAHYSSITNVSHPQTVRQWLSTQSYQAQMEYGLRILDKANRGLPLN